MKLTAQAATGGITFWATDRGSIYSMDPPDAWDQMNVWARMVPPMNPGRVLLLGVAKNTLGRLIKARWPDAPITLVDIDPVEGDTETIRSDAYEYLKGCADDAFDLVIVDTYLEQVLDPVAGTHHFSGEVKRVSQRACLNLPALQLEAIRPWFDQDWRLQDYRNQKLNHVFFLARHKR